jgi:hypothetical protein
LPPPAVCRWPLWLRVVVSIVVAFHVFAVFVGPWAALPDQASPLAQDCRAIVGPYDDVLCLGNGYRFFAPEPGPSHLVKYKVTLKDGKTIEGKFPDRHVNRPRLLYHRYFMLSEMLNSLYVPEDRPEDRVMFNLYVKSYARHLLHAYNGKEVQLTLIEHRIPAIEEYQKSKVKLTDEQLYEELQLGTFQENEP